MQLNCVIHLSSPFPEYSPWYVLRWRNLVVRHLAIPQLALKARLRAVKMKTSFAIIGALAYVVALVSAAETPANDVAAPEAVPTQAGAGPEAATPDDHEDFGGGFRGFGGYRGYGGYGGYGGYRGYGGYGGGYGGYGGGYGGYRGGYGGHW
ncbi:unnamed protein product [Phytophthora lilii]|uniref:Unnamed protein product n=1 Tax=Phytophthora lilii TaxID=2077276 RepID=A0A9W6TNN8_9STRA|nr:unnamed protein product [Phytophthora lilii]